MEGTMRTPYRWDHIHLISWSGLLALGLLATLGAAEKKAGDNLLWYRQPEEKWVKAGKSYLLTVSNGSIEE